MLNKSGYRAGTLVLFLTLDGKFSAFIIEYDVSCGLVIFALYYVEEYSFYTHFVESFFLSHKWMSNLFKCFFQMYWDDLLIFILHFNVYHIALQMLNHPGIPKINPSWLWCMFLLMYYWIRLANILLMMFTSPFIRVITLWFSLLVASLSGFGSRIILAS